MTVRHACIVLPTYNESANIREILESARKSVSPLEDWTVHFLVVDDRSPDGTGDIVREMLRTFPRLHLLEGKKEGLGRAYIRGFQWVLRELPEVQAVFEMDSDFSHDPAYLPAFLNAAAEGFTFVIGSRYVPGGDCPDWEWHRRLLSSWGNKYIRLVGGLSNVRDCTSGFRCISTALLRSIDFEAVGTRGYAFQMGLLNQALLHGARVQEIPIVFMDRRVGHSKLGRKDVLECLFTATFLRLRPRLMRENLSLEVEPSSRG